MRYSKWMMVVLVIAGMVLAGFVSSQQQVKKARNLKVLPQDISDAKLDSIMHSYNKALGVCCEFCHVQDKKNKEVIDFAADDNPVKELARKMIRLTIDINKNYFNTDTTVHPAYLNVVKCYTCHKGDAYPQ